MWPQVAADRRQCDDALIAFYGQSIVDRFPTHAEQFNQNINSQG